MRNKVLKRMRTYNTLAEKISQATTVEIVMCYKRYSLRQRILMAFSLLAVIAVICLLFFWLGGVFFIARAFLSLYAGAIVAAVLYGAFFIFSASDGTYLPLNDKEAYVLLGQEITRIEQIFAKAVSGRERLEPWLSRMSSLAMIVEEEELGYHWQHEDVDAHDEYRCSIMVKFSDEEFETEFEVGEAGCKKMECDITERIAGHWGLGRDSEEIARVLADIRKLSGYTKDD